MPPQSRGPTVPYGLQSKSTPNLPTPRTLRELRDTSNRPSTSSNASPATLHAGQPGSPDIITSPSEPASLEVFALDISSTGSSSDDASEEEAEERDSQIPNLPINRPIYHHHSRSHSYLGPSAFAPPFYGRPPTPLPPSPSLTSLLRPTFTSATPSRPTTPDPSSDENPTRSRPRTSGKSTSTNLTTPATGLTTGTATPTSSTTTTTALQTLSTLQQTQAAHPIPSARPAIPTYEYYGFALYLLSSLLYAIYLFWAFLPQPFLHQLGIYYYPNRWWALAVPSWVVVGVVWIYVALGSWNTGYLTLGLEEIGVVVDGAGVVGVVDERGVLVRGKGRGEVVKSGRGRTGKGRVKGVNGGTGRRSRRGSLEEKVGLGIGHVEAPKLDWRELWNEGTDAVIDIPIGGVCEILYGEYSEDEDEDDALERANVMNGVR